MAPETGYDEVANVGIKDGKISVVTTAMHLEMGSYSIDEFHDYWEGNALINYGAEVSHAFARLHGKGRLYLFKRIRGGV